MTAEDYIHRIGRTGRAGARGVAISLVARPELGKLRGIERLTGRRMVRRLLAGLEPAPSAASGPGHREPRAERGRAPGGRQYPNGRRGRGPLGRHGRKESVNLSPRVS